MRKGLILLTMLPAILAVGSVNAEVIFFDSFEDPVVPGLNPEMDAVASCLSEGA